MVSLLLPARLPTECITMWNETQEIQIKNDWSPRADTILRALVKNLGPNQWESISQHLNSLAFIDKKNVTNIQCKNRWENVLNINESL